MKTSKETIICILFLALILRLNFALYTPNWQAADEYPHFFVIKYISLYGSYPESKPDFPYYEAYQPPLYYYAASLIYNIFKSYDSPAPKIDEKFDPDTLTHPPNTALIVLRLFSVLIGMVTLFLIYKIASIFFKDYNTIYVLLISATLPSFVVNSSSVTNDALANLLGALLLYILVYQMNDVKKSLYNKSILLGLVFGLALLTKANLYPFLFVILAGLFLHPLTLKDILKNFILIISIAILISSLYFYQNVLNYGSIITISPGLQKDYFLENISLGKILYALRNFFWSFWAAAGRIYQIHLEASIYVFLFFPLTLVSIAGNLKFIFLKSFISFHQIYKIYLFLFSILVLLLSALYFNLISEQHSAWGRYMYPALGSFLILFVFGIKQILREKFFRYTILMLFLVQVVVCAYLFLELIK